MPILASRGGASLKGFGFGGGAGFVCASGGTVLTVGDYKTHVFTGPGTFTVNKGGKVDYFVVAGGGSSSQSFAGGGGAGGFRMSNYEGLPSPTTSPLAAGTGLTFHHQYQLQLAVEEILLHHLVLVTMEAPLHFQL